MHIQPHGTLQTKNKFTNLIIDFHPYNNHPNQQPISLLNNIASPIERNLGNEQSVVFFYFKCSSRIPKIEFNYGANYL